MQKVGIFGNSGIAREMGDIAVELGLSPVYILRDSLEAGPEMVGRDYLLERDVPQHAADMEFVIGIGDGTIRKKVYERFAGMLTFRNLVHPQASFGWRQRERIGASVGVVVCAGVRMTTDIEVGNFTIFNINATVGHDCVIDDFAVVSPGANISGNVHIRERAWIGTGACINQGTPEKKLEIGAGAMIGAGAVVVQDCQPDGTYVGVPAKRIK